MFIGINTWPFHSGLIFSTQQYSWCAICNLKMSSIDMTIEQKDTKTEEIENSVEAQTEVEQTEQQEKKESPSFCCGSCS